MSKLRAEIQKMPGKLAPSTCLSGRLEYKFLESSDIPIVTELSATEAISRRTEQMMIHALPFKVLKHLLTF